MTVKCTVVVVWVLADTTILFTVFGVFVYFYIFMVTMVPSVL